MKANFSVPHFTEQVHPRLIKHLYLMAELAFNDEEYEINEYDVQGWMYKFLAKKLKNTDHFPQRESEGKVDCVIKNHETGGAKVFYELKTYIKPHEEPTFASIERDIKKLFSKIGEDIDKKAFFVMMTTGNKLRNKRERSGLEFIKKYENHDRSWHVLDEHIRIRPSRRGGVGGRTEVFSWEVKCVAKGKNDITVEPKDFIDEVIDFLNEKNIVCPLASEWNDLWKRLPNNTCNENGEWSVRLPLILGEWHYSTNEQKRQRFEEHIRWANEHKVLEKIYSIILEISDDRWEYK